MRKLVLTPKFKRAYSKFVRRDRSVQKPIEETLKQVLTSCAIKRWQKLEVAICDLKLGWKTNETLCIHGTGSCNAVKPSASACETTQEDWIYSKGKASCLWQKDKGK
jgi:hypothetical protein